MVVDNFDYERLREIEKLSFVSRYNFCWLIIDTEDYFNSRLYLTATDGCVQFHSSPAALLFNNQPISIEEVIEKLPKRFREEFLFNLNLFT